MKISAREATHGGERKEVMGEQEKDQNKTMS
jgi:hypothetical protein